MEIQTEILAAEYISIVLISVFPTVYHSIKSKHHVVSVLSDWL